jgi:arylesterase/paraoxonase
MRRILGFLMVLVIAALVIIGVRIFDAAGYFSTVEPVAADCAPIEAPKGPEDIAIDRQSGIIFISSTDRRAIIAGNTEIRGDIFALRASAPQEGAQSLLAGNTDAPSDFKPHGISLYDDGQGGKTLMVINHTGEADQQEHTIEIFDVISDQMGGVKLDHRRTVSDPLLVAPNDVAAIDHERFYVTNDHGNPPGFRRELETWLLLPEANIVYYDGRKMSVVADGLTYANGIALSPDRGSVYAAETTGRAVRIYARNAGTGALSSKETIHVGTGADNIDVDPGGNIWLAAHPKMLDLLSHSSDEAVLSPSQVIRIPIGPRGFGEPKTVYLDLGEQMSGSSTAVAEGNRIFISDIFDPKMLVCRITS